MIMRMASPAQIPSCHPERKYHSKGLCASCSVMAWQKRNPERVRTYNRRGARKWHLKAVYGMTVEQYEEMWTAQGGRCANRACSYEAPMRPLIFPRRRRPFADPNRPLIVPRALVVDHCHRTGKVRGLICPRCNTALGLAGDDKQGLQGLIDYLSTRG